MTEPRSFLTGPRRCGVPRDSRKLLQALWPATDILIAGQYSEEQIWTFGEVIERLAEDIEITWHVQLANKLAASNNAPTKIIKNLAFDNSIDVAEPVLRQSGRVRFRNAGGKCSFQEPAASSRYFETKIHFR